MKDRTLFPELKIQKLIGNPQTPHDQTTRFPIKQSYTRLPWQPLFPSSPRKRESRWQENKMRSRMSTASRLIVGISKTFVTI